MTPDRAWQLLVDGSDALADELGLEAPPPVFTPTRGLEAVDAWLAAHDGPLDEEDTARLGFFLARVLIETHGGGLTEIHQPGHPLDGEWAVTGFERGLPPDYHAPFLVAAARIGLDRELGAAAWYQKLLAEGHA